MLVLGPVITITTIELYLPLRIIFVVDCVETVCCAVGLENPRPLRLTTFLSSVLLCRGWH